VEEAATNGQPDRKQPAAPSRRGWVTAGLLVLLLGAAALVWYRWPSQAAPVEPPASVRPSPRGWQVRYNANLSLAVKGSKKVRLDLLTEMLDENKQLKNFRVQLKSGQDVPDESGARKTILNTLRAITEWHKKLDVVKAYGRDNPQLRKVYAALKTLAEDSPNAVVRQEAKRTRLALHLD
jgi:hypothetical protein